MQPIIGSKAKQSTILRPPAAKVTGTMHRLSVFAVMKQKRWRLRFHVEAEASRLLPFDFYQSSSRVPALYFFRRRVSIVPILRKIERRCNLRSKQNLGSFQDRRHYGGHYAAT